MGLSQSLAIAAVAIVACTVSATAASTPLATIAFTSTRGCSGSSSYGGIDPSDIYTTSPDGSDVHQITHDCLSSDPAWSPDGRRIAFVSRRDGLPAVYVMNASGTDAHRVSADGVAAWQPAWSSLGRIAYAVDWPTSQRGVWTAAPDGSGSTRLTDYGERPSWSPDGSRMAFTDKEHGDSRSQPAIATMSADGSGVRRIGYGWGPAYAPDGTHLAWIASDYPVDQRARITVAGTDGSSPTTIAMPGDGFLDLELAWSPSSDAIAYQSGTTLNEEIYVVPARGGTATRVTVNAAQDTDPDWRPATPSTGLALERVAFRKGACARRPGTAVVAVADAQGRPLAGAAVVITGGRAAARATTGASGTAAVAVPAPTLHRGRLALLVRASLAGRPSVAKHVSLPRC